MFSYVLRRIKLTSVERGSKNLKILCSPVTDLIGHPEVLKPYRGRLYSAQDTFKRDQGRAGQNSLATAGTKFTKPGAHNKGDLCTHISISLYAQEAWRGNSLANLACLHAIYSGRSSAEAAMTMNCMTRDKMIKTDGSNNVI